MSFSLLLRLVPSFVGILAILHFVGAASYPRMALTPVWSFKTANHTNYVSRLLSPPTNFVTSHAVSLDLSQTKNPDAASSSSDMDIGASASPTSESQNLAPVGSLASASASLLGSAQINLGDPSVTSDSPAPVSPSSSFSPWPSPLASITPVLSASESASTTSTPVASASVLVGVVTSSATASTMSTTEPRRSSGPTKTPTPCPSASLPVGSPSQSEMPMRFATPSPTRTPNSVIIGNPPISPPPDETISTTPDIKSTPSPSVGESWANGNPTPSSVVITGLGSPSPFPASPSVTVTSTGASAPSLYTLYPSVSASPTAVIVISVSPSSSSQASESPTMSASAFPPASETPSFSSSVPPSPSFTPVPSVFASTSPSASASEYITPILTPSISATPPRVLPSPSPTMYLAPSPSPTGSSSFLAEATESPEFSIEAEVSPNGSELAGYDSPSTASEYPEPTFSGDPGTFLMTPDPTLTATWDESAFPSEGVLVPASPAGGEQIGETSTIPTPSSGNGILNQETASSPSLGANPSTSALPTTEILLPSSVSASPSVVLIASPSSTPTNGFASPSSTVVVSVTPSLSPLQGSPSPSLAPDSVTDSDTVIVPSSFSPEADFPDATPVAAPNPEVVGVPDTNDTGIVQGTDGPPNTTLADEEGVAPSIIEGGPWKELVSTGPASIAFPVLMGIVGSLLLILLMICLFFAILKGGAGTYSYSSQYSDARPSDYGTNDGGGAYINEGAPAGGGGLYGPESPPITYEPGGVGGYGGGTYNNYEMAPGDPSLNYETPPTGGEYGYDTGGRTTLRNASVGTAEYPTPAQLPEELDIGAAHGALTGYAEGTEYPYSHPYGEPYEDSGRTVHPLSDMHNAPEEYSESETRATSQATSYGTGGIQETSRYAAPGAYDVSETCDIYEEGHTGEACGDDYADGETGVVFEGVYDDDVGSGPNFAVMDKAEDEQNSQFIFGSQEGADTLQESVPYPAGDNYSSLQRSEQFADNLHLEPYTNTSRKASSTGTVLQQVDFSSGGSNPAPTPYEMESNLENVENLSVNEAGSNEVSTFVASDDGEVVDEQTEGVSTSFNGYADIAATQQGTLSAAFRASARSHASSGGPWPEWWKEAGEREKGIKYDNIIGGESKENASLFNNTNRRVEGLIETAAENEDCDPHKSSDVNPNFGQVGSLFGPRQVIGDSDWQRNSHRTSTKQLKKELNPEFDYLRKLREPYVKVVANRLSLGALSSPTTSESLKESSHEQKSESQKEDIDPRQSDSWINAPSGIRI